MEKIIDDLDEFYKKIKELQQIKIDSDNWVTYYLDNKTNEKWIEERIYSEMQAGGPPQLRLIGKFPWEG